MNGLQILGTGRAVPEQIVTNDDLAQRVDTNDEWIVARTGIRERRFAAGETLTDLTVEAARKAMERAGVQPQDIGLCITATVTPDRLFPSQACLIHQKLGLPEDCPAFDLSAGCTGFLFAMETAAAMLPRMNRPYALLVGGELLSRILDMDDRSTCILFGDGAGAAVVKTTENAPWFAQMGSRGDRDILWAWGPGQERPYLHMDGQGVFQFAIKTVPQVAKQLLEKAGLDKDQVDWYVPHQANHRIVESAAKRLKVPLERFYENMDRYGNTSAGSIPIALDEMVEKGLLQRGQWVMCLGFGAGLTWGGALFQW
jgi:3-oxoacyl-[acyl-carrier-protein] synthase III